MGRVIAAVVTGYCSIGVLVWATDQAFAAAIPGFKSMTMPPVYYFVLSLISDSLYSAIGGYLCCAIARTRCRTASLALIVAGELIGIAAQVALWNTVPHWFGISLLVLYPPSVWFGSRLRAHGKTLPLRSDI
ncbi:MAG TPA: hypothetical protein VK604_05735 [Bryobacteraceae bacterium]|nr:hypothetical protein [Bryobacteraceae bacterium]